MTPAPVLPHPAYPGTEAQPWLEIVKRCFKRSGRLHKRAWELASGHVRVMEATQEYIAALFWGRVANRAMWYAGYRDGIGSAR